MALASAQQRTMPISALVVLLPARSSSEPTVLSDVRFQG